VFRNPLAVFIFAVPQAWQMSVDFCGQWIPANTGLTTAAFLGYPKLME
jgi:hypothetical protein